MERDEESRIGVILESNRSKLQYLMDHIASINEFELGEDIMSDSFRRSADETGDEMWK